MERIPLESCVCGECTYCPDGYHGNEEACGCTADCVLCECGRGPILPGNMVPDVCAYCFAERYCAECGEPLSVAPGRACRPGTVHDIASEWGAELAPLVARAMQ